MGISSHLHQLAVAPLQNVLLVRRRSNPGWSGASEPGQKGGLIILLSHDAGLLRRCTWSESVQSGPLRPSDHRICWSCAPRDCGDEGTSQWSYYHPGRFAEVLSTETRSSARAYPRNEPSLLGVEIRNSEQGQYSRDFTRTGKRRRGIFRRSLWGRYHVDILFCPVFFLFLSASLYGHKWPILCNKSEWSFLENAATPFFKTTSSCGRLINDGNFWNSFQDSETKWRNPKPKNEKYIRKIALMINDLAWTTDSDQGYYYYSREKTDEDREANCGASVMRM